MISIVFANKIKEKKRPIGTYRENPITTTPSLSNTYRNNPLSFIDETRGAFGTVSLATSAGSPFED